MHVAIDVSQALYGTGVSDYTTSLVSALPASTVYPFSFTLQRQDEIRRLFPSVKIIPLGPKLSDILWNQVHLLPIDGFLGKFDILHTSDWTEPRSKTPKVTTVHDLAPLAYPEATSAEIVATHKRKLNWVKRESNKVICVSEFTANELRKFLDIPFKRIEVIYEAAAKKLDISPTVVNKEPYILAMGSRQPRKNIPRLIEAYVKYKPKLRLPKLVITGESMLSSNNPDIEFSGYVDDQRLVNLFANAELFVYPSFYEGFGQPILEAFKFKVPVVASQSSSIPEVAGDAAVLVDPFSIDAIGVGIGEALKNRQALITAGEKQQKKFNWSKTAEQTLELYKSLC